MQRAGARFTAAALFAQATSFFARGASFFGWPVFLLALVVACDRDPGFFFRGGQSPVEVGPLPRGVDSLSADACKSCHPSDYADWKASVHGRAWTDPLFQDSLMTEPAIWCVNCHAPLKEQALPSVPGQPAIAERKAIQAPGTVSLREEGINCAACHVREGKILVSREDRLAESDRYHPARYEPFLKRSEFCGGCHQFNFPYYDRTRAVHPGPSPMQNTYREWRGSASSWIGITCQECHASTENHRIYGPHTPGWLEKKISVEARLLDTESAPTVNVVLQLRGIAHSLPTGDLFRGIGIEIRSGREVLGEVSYGRKTGDTSDPDAPNGMYKRFIRENVLQPGTIQPSIDETIRIALRRAPEHGEALTCRVIYYFRNREAENPNREESLLRKTISETQVRETRHRRPNRNTY